MSIDVVERIMTSPERDALYVSALFELVDAKVATTTELLALDKRDVFELMTELAPELDKWQLAVVACGRREASVILGFDPEWLHAEIWR